MGTLGSPLRQSPVSRLEDFDDQVGINPDSIDPADANLSYFVAHSA